ncbi:hypothetical protein T11_1355 [Trichinella zimbabwensis]|uniref:Uncharacterized protein n=1 Tax=Trichinella zimbabwensis TaxID=268475 RepID=A0A0V1H5F9_9BILA|nr:hypothetical protein T11_1355 [Trichinella zimbabwensis]
MKAVRNAEWGLMGLRSSISYLLTTPYISNRTCRRITMRVVSCGKEESEKTETYRLSQVVLTEFGGLRHIEPINEKATGILSEI